MKTTDTSPVLAALREATREQHNQLDALSPLTSATMDRTAYLEHAARVLGWMRPLEQALWTGPAAPLLPAGLEPQQRNVKVSWLASDLAEGGLTRAQIDDLALCPYTPAPATLAQSMGVAYVSEGATLGGAFLYKQLAPRLGGLSLQWLRGYGTQTGRMWQTFMQVLAEQVLSQDEILQAQHAAQQAFDSFRRWVIDEAPVSKR